MSNPYLGPGNPDSVLCVVSGGLDSVTMAYDLKSKGWDVGVICFDYGQKHSKELFYASYHAHKNGWQYDTINLRDIGGRLRSALLLDGDVPEGHYAAKSMKATIVPNRNAIMLSIACGVAISRDIPYIAAAMHSGDHFIYPDCRPRFLQTLNLALMEGNDPDFQGILAPYVTKDKNWIAQRAVDLGYEWEHTWSCYKGGDKHCGRCGTCVERMEALWSTNLHTDLAKQRLQVLFPKSLYEDRDFFLQALENA